jgi:hypothetical protein
MAMLCQANRAPSLQRGIVKRKVAISRVDILKKSSHTIYFSTLNPNQRFCYNDARVVKWGLAI